MAFQRRLCYNTRQFYKNGENRAMVRIFCVFCILLSLYACADKSASKPSVEQAPTSEVDLGIGDTPTLPTNKEIDTPNLIEGIEVSKALLQQYLDETTEETADDSIDSTQTPQNAQSPQSTSAQSKQPIPRARPLLQSSANRNPTRLRDRIFDTSDAVAILSGSGTALTVWALAAGNWLWAYPPFNSVDLGSARQWRVLTRANGKVSFQNVLTKTCMSAYKNGVIHVPCQERNPSQLWNLNPLSNRALQLQNEATKTCLQTPVIRTKNYGAVYLASCLTQENPLRGNDNISRQWIITAPLASTPPIFTIN